MTISASTDDWLKTAGARIHIRRSGAGKPLLLINGFGADVSDWEPLTALLPDRELIAFDQPGMGQSTFTPRPVRMSALARMTVAVLDHCGIERADVLGYSLGGVLAQELACTAPERVRRLVLAATTPGVPSMGPPPAAIRLLMSSRRYTDPEFAADVLKRLAGGRTARDPDMLRAAVQRRLAEPANPQALRRQLWSGLGWSAQRRLPKLRIPTLVLYPGDDPLVPISNAHRLASLIHDSRLEIIPGAGHLFLFDDPACAVPLIRDHLDRPQRL